MIPPNMDPADSSERFRREVTDKVNRQCNLWLEAHEEGFRRAVEKRLKETLSCFPWVLDTLYPIVADFLANTLHLHSPIQAALQPDQLGDPQPDTPAPASSKKRRSRRRRSSPQPDSRTSQQPAVVSHKDNFSFFTPSVCLLRHCETAKPVTQAAAQSSTPPTAASIPLPTPAAVDAAGSKMNSISVLNSFPVTEIESVATDCTSLPLPLLTASLSAQPIAVAVPPFTPPSAQSAVQPLALPISPQPTPAASAGPAGDGPTVFITAVSKPDSIVSLDPVIKSLIADEQDETVSSEPKDRAQSVTGNSRPTMENKLENSDWPEDEKELAANSGSLISVESIENHFPCSPSEDGALIFEAVNPESLDYESVNLKDVVVATDQLVTQSAAQPVTQSAAQPVTQSAAQPVAVAQPAAQPVAVAQPAAQPVAVAQPAAQPVAVAQPAAQPVAVAQPASQPVAVAQPAAQPVAVAQPAAQPVAVAQPAAQPVAVAQPAAQPVAVAQPAAQPVAVAQPAAQPVAVAQPAAQPVAVAQPAAQPVAVAQPASQPVAVAQPAAQPVAVAQPAAQPVAVAQPAAQPVAVAQPAAQPVAVAQPAAQPAAQPVAVAQPAAQPVAVAQPAAQPLRSPAGCSEELSLPSEDCLPGLEQADCPAQPQPRHHELAVSPVLSQPTSSLPEISIPAGHASVFAEGSEGLLQLSSVSPSTSTTLPSSPPPAAVSPSSPSVVAMLSEGPTPPVKELGECEVPAPPAELPAPPAELPAPPAELPAPSRSRSPRRLLRSSASQSRSSASGRSPCYLRRDSACWRDPLSQS
ncbi:proline-rich protein 36-like [Pelmatolapia mariae]|uniref:proline-rich protein 36-like n=1 Tax=Pelmatolapia mariae TaxID=158779 RepID=UPI002FE6BDF9